MKNLYKLITLCIISACVTTIYSQDIKTPLLALNDEKVNTNDLKKGVVVVVAAAKKKRFTNRQMHITAMANYDESIDLELFFDPGSDFLNLIFDRYLENYRASLFHMDGHLVMSVTIKQMKAGLDFSNLEPSIYFLDISDPDFKLVKSFKLERFFKGYF